MRKTSAVVIRIDRNHFAKKAGPVDWARVEDRDLVDGMIDRDNGAWREFMRRMGPTISKRIKFVMSRFWRSLRTNDTFAEIKAEFIVALLQNDMARLRAFNPDKGGLVQWMSLIAQQTATSHLLKASRRPTEVEEEVVEEEGQDHQRGAYWVAEGL